MVVKVLVLFTYGYSLSTWKNSGTFYKELETYKKLSKKGVSFIFVTFANNEPHIEYLKKYNIDVIPVYEYIKKSRYKLINYFKSFLIPYYLKKMTQEIDIIKQNQLHGSWIAIILKIILKKPLFIRTGYDMYQFSIKEGKNRFIRFLYKFLTSVSLKYSDLYTVSSKCDIEFLEGNFNVERNYIKLRPNWVKNLEVKNFNQRFENKIISVGRLESQKNLEYLIKAFANTKYEIDLVGEGSLASDLKKLAVHNNVIINFLGQLGNEELLDLLKSYKYYVSFSHFEGNPKSTLEAISAGCVVFLSNIPNHEELITHEVNGFLISVASESFIDIFEKTINTFDLGKISESAREYTLRNNSLDTLVEMEFKDLKKLTV
jgi:glycosyltransferase involved in cell wall biosynthesis